MYKKIRIHLLTLLLFTPALHGVEFERKTVKSMDGSSMLCFKQPATMDDKQFLVHLLKKTEQKRKVKQLSKENVQKLSAQLIIAGLADSVPVPANMPKDWCTLWGQSIEEDATK